MTPLAEMTVDSAEGIEYLFRWAKAHGYVLDEYHAQIAEKYGVSTEGVAINRPLPLTGKAENMYGYVYTDNPSRTHVIYNDGFDLAAFPEPPIGMDYAAEIAGADIMATLSRCGIQIAAQGQQLIDQILTKPLTGAEFISKTVAPEPDYVTINRKSRRKASAQRRKKRK